VLALGLALLGAAPQAAADQVEELFGFLDANGDGMIDAQEFQLRKTEIFFRSISDLDAVTTLGPEDTNLAPEAFAEADLDGDGRLSGAEFVQARFARFELYDADSNQAITFAEFEGFVRQFLRD
jgi:Ca2+-binding EF-hand superfamily protein